MKLINHEAKNEACTGIMQVSVKATSNIRENGVSIENNIHSKFDNRICV